jgi:hypothetical protein
VENWQGERRRVLEHRIEKREEFGTKSETLQFVNIDMRYPAKVNNPDGIHNP